jgi:hypothetical protein
MKEESRLKKKHKNKKLKMKEKKILSMHNFINLQTIRALNPIEVMNGI